MSHTYVLQYQILLQVKRLLNLKKVNTFKTAAQFCPVQVARPYLSTDPLPMQTTQKNNAVTTTSGALTQAPPLQVG